MYESFLKNTITQHSCPVSDSPSWLGECGYLHIHCESCRSGEGLKLSYICVSFFLLNVVRMLSNRIILLQALYTVDSVALLEVLEQVRVRVRLKILIYFVYVNVCIYVMLCLGCRRRTPSSWHMKFERNFCRI